MRLYLSSFRMGDHPEYLTAVVGGDRRRTVVIANAMDDAPESLRRPGVERELAALGELGFGAAELDLHDYFDDEQAGYACPSSSSVAMSAGARIRHASVTSSARRPASTSASRSITRGQPS